MKSRICKISTPVALTAIMIAVMPVTALSWSDQLRGMTSGGAGASTDLTSLSGLWERSGEYAIDSGGGQGGFLDDDEIRIPLPGVLEDARTLLSRAGLSGELDAAEEAINRAAEKTVAAAKPLLMDAIRGMSVQDAPGILRDSPDGATRYLREHEGESITQALLPITSEALESTGANGSIDSLMGKALRFLPGVGGLQELSLESHVNDKVVDGIFHLMARREAEIRKDPLGTGMDLLRKVPRP